MTQSFVELALQASKNPERVRKVTTLYNYKPTQEEQIHYLRAKRVASDTFSNSKIREEYNNNIRLQRNSDERVYPDLEAIQANYERQQLNK